MKKYISLTLAVLTLAVVLVGSLAYFTDRVDASASATAGTLDLVLSPISASHSTDMKPGYASNVTYTLTNAGTKSADILETMVLSTSVAMTSANPEFMLYPASAVTLDGTGKITAITGSPVPSSLSADRKKITFDLTNAGSFVLSGTNSAGKTDAEIEYNGSTAYPNAKSGSYVLVFSAAATNAFMNLTLDMDYMAQAKQHRNTNEATWSTLQSSVSFANGTIQAVPAA